MKKVRVGVLGAASLTSETLIRFLIGHPSVEITSLNSDTFPGEKVEKAHPIFKNFNLPDLSEFDPNKMKKDCDLVFSAKPPKHGFFYISQLLERGVKVIDLSADFRLKDPEIYFKFYNRKHEKPELLKEAVYGMPELYLDKIKTADLIANPGCYPTGIILGCAPLLKEKLVSPPNIIINAISGASGAGRTDKGRNLFLDIHSNILPYQWGTHPHTGEIEQELFRLYGEPVSIFFTPNVGPFEHGIVTYIYLSLKDKRIDDKALYLKYKKFYQGKSFVRVFSPDEDLPQVKNIIDSNFCDIGIRFDKKTKTCVIVTVIDNEVKGAGGQAIQNMNIRFGFDETDGLRFKV
ncbi:MAG: N-acetyl-gamma-glutamyl-phosphate reductase [Deltaproteobacteria bacterium]|nr:MAG: N-acetyl-gamma-glutamyl-phosphate reductase [Deltaproteobacteria bacterium]